MNEKRLITSKIIDLFESNYENLFIDDFCYYDIDEELYSNKPYSKIDFPASSDLEYDEAYDYLNHFHKKILN